MSRSHLVAVRARYRVFGIYNVAGARCRPFKGTGGNTDWGGVQTRELDGVIGQRDPCDGEVSIALVAALSDAPSAHVGESELVLDGADCWVYRRRFEC